MAGTIESPAPGIAPTPGPGLDLRPTRRPPPAVGFFLRHGRAGRWGLALVVIAVAGFLPEFAGVAELTRVQQILFYVMLAFGFNISLGFAGEFAVAQPVVYGMAAYTAGVMSVHWGISPWVTLPTALGFGCGAGFLLCAPGFRLKGWYLAITTFFAAVVFPHLVNVFAGVTEGTNGLAGIAPLPSVGLVLGSSARLYWILLAITLVLLMGMYNVSRGSWGVILRGVRDAPRAAEACGVNIWLAKMLLSIVAAFPVALAGWAFAHASGTISTQQFTLNLGIIIVAGVVIGGMGTVWGPVIGTVIVELISLWIGPFSDYNTLLVGAAILFFAIMLPHGLVRGWSSLCGRIGVRLGWVRPPQAALVAAGGAESEAMAGVVSAEAADRLAGLTVGADGPAPDGAGAYDRPGAAGGAGAPAGSNGANGATPPAAAGEVVLQVEGIHKRFSGVVVLDGVDLEVRRGEVVGLIGPNGSGKTTLVNVVTGHLRADEGRVHLFGEPIQGKAPHQISANGVRRTFQVPRLIGELSVVDNIRLGLLGARRQEVLGSMLTLPGYRIRTNRQLPRITDVCTLVGLGPATWDQRVDSLPLGTRRVVEVARAVVAGPALVCLDEPGAGLGGEALTVLGRVMRRVADAGSAVVVIEHNLEFVRGVTDRVVEMQDGRVVAIPEGGTARAAASGTPS